MEKEGRQDASSCAKAAPSYVDFYLSQDHFSDLALNENKISLCIFRFTCMMQANPFDQSKLVALNHHHHHHHRHDDCLIMADLLISFAFH